MLITLHAMLHCSKSLPLINAQYLPIMLDFPQYVVHMLCYQLIAPYVDNTRTWIGNARIIYVQTS